MRSCPAAIANSSIAREACAISARSSSPYCRPISSQEPLQRITRGPSISSAIGSVLLPDDSIVVDAGGYVAWWSPTQREPAVRRRTVKYNLGHDLYERV